MAISTEQSPSVSLARRAAHGDHAAFTQLVLAYDVDLVRACFVITGDSTAAREAVQDAWDTAWSRRKQLNEPERFRAWVTAIACNRAREHRRSRNRRTARETTLDDPTAAISSADRYADPDLAAALARLSALDRQVLALKFVLGWTSAEIARATGLSPSGARVRTSRAVSRLRKDLS